MIRFLAILCLVIAWMGPHLTEKTKVENLTIESKDVLFLLDLSHSMLANDLKPNRIDRAKLAIKSITEDLKGSNFGLIVFTNTAFTQCPLTYDQNFFSKMLDFSNPNLIQSQGTDLYPAMNLAYKQLSKNDDLSIKSKIIVLVSDGEDFGDEMKSITKEIKQNKIKVFCLGVGTETGSTIKIGDELKRDAQRNLVRTKINRISLQKLANISDGSYFEISNTRNDIQQLKVALSNIKGETTKSENSKAPNVTFYHYFALLSVFILVFDFLYKPRTFESI